MALSSAGVVTLENGSAAVVGVGTTWVDDGVQVGAHFQVPLHAVTYEVAAVISNTALTLSAPYQGADEVGKAYSIGLDFTANAGLPVPTQGEVNPHQTIKRMAEMLDTAIGPHAALVEQYKNEAAQSATTATAAAGSVSDGVLKAQDWAEKAVDVEVEPGSYSSMHHAVKAEGHKDAAAGHEGAAQDWAEKAVDVEVVPGSYSAMHHASKAEGHKDAAAGHEGAAQDWAEKAVDVEVEPGSFSAKHHATKAEGHKDAAAGHEGAAQEWAEADPFVDLGGGQYSAKHHSARAAAWATRDEDAEVLPGQFSAKHHALKAAASAASLVGTLRYQGAVDLSGGAFPASPADGDLYRVSVAGSVAGVTYAEGEFVFFQTGDGWQVLGGAGGGGAVIAPAMVAVSNGHALTAADNGKGSLLDLSGGAQTVVLPSLASVPDGFSHTVAATGLPSAHLAAYVDTGALADKVLYWGQLVDRHYLIGGGEAFQFVAVTQGAARFWYCVTVQQPAQGHFDVTISYVHTVPAWNTTPTAWTAVVGSLAQGPGSAMVSRSNCGILAPVTGKYDLFASVFYTASGGGGVAGLASISWGVDGVLQRQLGIARNYYWTGASGYDLGAWAASVLTANQKIEPYQITGNSNIYYWPDDNEGRFKLTQR